MCLTSPINVSSHTGSGSVRLQTLKDHMTSGIEKPYMSASSKPLQSITLQSHSALGDEGKSKIIQTFSNGQVNYAFISREAVREIKEHHSFTWLDAWLVKCFPFTQAP